MIQFFISLCLLLTSIMFINMIHPLAMGLMLLIQTMLICMITGLITKSFWFSYILFLIFLGGMLVLFIYVTSLASNEMFSLSMKLTFYLMLILLSSLLIMFMVDLNLLTNWMINNEMQSSINMNSYIMENSLNLNKLYNFPSNLITIMLMNYLLITLIAVVKITKFSKGPLRLMSN